MTVRETSMITYFELLAEGVISERQNMIYKCLKKNPSSTDLEIATYLGFGDPNAVRPRRKELYDMGLVVNLGKRRCSVSDRYAFVWSVQEHTTEDKVYNVHAKDTLGEDGFVYRKITSKSMLEAVAKAMQYSIKFSARKYEVFLLAAVWDRGVYKINLRRKNI